LVYDSYRIVIHFELRYVTLRHDGRQNVNNRKIGWRVGLILMSSRDLQLLIMNRNAHFSHSRSNNKYLDVDDILATQERVMCNFEVSVLNMGMLQCR